ncbi:helix-turn-helix domain-containing protein [Phytohabitans flavus]|uniref:helix-turn-helix domain-containing protein n=1 Tax=Phytohabitans flavus TaxID=1076124 RepID=UPI00362CFD9B
MTCESVFVMAGNAITARDPNDLLTQQDLLEELNRLRIIAARRRGKVRLSLQDLAAASGVPKSSLANYLAGKTVMPVDVLDRLVLALGVGSVQAGAWAAAWERATENTRPVPATATPPSGPARAPRQLPLDISTFVGRDRDLDALKELGFGASTRPGPLIVITGAPGVGKSALAVRAANVASAQFPDGQLYLNMLGSTPQVPPLSPVEGLGRLLRSLGVAARDVPHDTDECATLLRTLLADRRLILVLDNVASVAQVRPLLPGGTGITTLITSRTNLAVVEGSVQVRISPLVPTDSVNMLAHLLGEGRVAGERGDALRLAQLCDHLPLGLHLAAARLKARPTWTLAALADRLADERQRLTELASGDLAVRGSLLVSHAALRHSPDPAERSAARALSMVGLVRTAELDLDLAAALLDTSARAAERSLEHLVDAHLVEPAGPGRFRLHDLVRLFAHEQATTDLAPDQTNGAVTRVLRYGLATIRDAVERCYPHRTHYPLPDVDVTPRPFADQADAAAWLERERANLVALTRQGLAGDPEQARLGMAMARAMFWFSSTAGTATTAPPSATRPAMSPASSATVPPRPMRPAASWARSTFADNCTTPSRCWRPRPRSAMR